MHCVIVLNSEHCDLSLYQFFAILKFYTMSMIVLFMTTFRIDTFSFPVSSNYSNWVLYLQFVAIQIEAKEPTSE